MADLKVQKKYGNEEFGKLFNVLIDEKISNIKIKIKQERNARYNNSNYPSTEENEVDNK